MASKAFNFLFIDADLFVKLTHTALVGPEQKNGKSPSIHSYYVCTRIFSDTAVKSMMEKRCIDNRESSFCENLCTGSSMRRGYLLWCPP